VVFLKQPVVGIYGADIILGTAGKTGGYLFILSAPSAQSGKIPQVLSNHIGYQLEVKFRRPYRNPALIVIHKVKTKDQYQGGNHYGEDYHQQYHLSFYRPQPFSHRILLEIILTPESSIKQEKNKRKDKRKNTGFIKKVHFKIPRSENNQLSR
jgi:hypothetical protein